MSNSNIGTVSVNCFGTLEQLKLSFKSSRSYPTYPKDAGGGAKSGYN